jgi:type I restriction-modification system DNA methylase subunit
MRGSEELTFTKNIIKDIQNLSGRHSTWKVFSDFCEMSAISISNTVDKTHYDERENRYLEIVKQYDKKEIELFPIMFDNLVSALDECFENGKLEDVLGRIFHALELHNEWKGQFFTPMVVCDMMGEITLQHPGKIIKERGYITVEEPACGSGATLLGIANSLKNRGYNYQKHMVVTATDIDLKCVHMAYIQLSLCGIPAVVIHGNSLTMEEWSKWYTPLYAWGRANGRIKDVVV